MASNLSFATTNQPAPHHHRRGRRQQRATAAAPFNHRGRPRNMRTSHGVAAAAVVISAFFQKRARVCSTAIGAFFAALPLLAFNWSVSYFLGAGEVATLRSF